jgi:hypothetical protein
MARYDQSEQTYRVALKAALVIEAWGDALDAMTGVAACWLVRGLEEEAARLLVFVIRHPDVRHDTFDFADEAFMDLESRACPRIITDAQAFILGKSLNSMANYIDTVDLAA